MSLSKLKFPADPRYGDIVNRIYNGEIGKFYGYSNASKTKCFVLWNAPSKQASASCDRAGVGPLDESVVVRTPYDSGNTTTEGARLNPNSNLGNAAENLSNDNVIMQKGDLLYYRAEDSVSGTARWMVVTQGPHRRTDCVAGCQHFPHETCKNGVMTVIEDPVCVAVAPALITSAGVSRTPAPSQQSECWFEFLANHSKKVSKILEEGYRVMCRENYHVCLISCRKYKKKIRALYCRMRMPRRPVEYTRFSQLCVPEKHADAVCTIASAIETNADTCVARPQLKIEQNQERNSYWEAGNRDVLAAPDKRALVVDLGRLTGKRAIDPQVREQVVPTLFFKLLGLLPQTEPQTTLKATFRSRPFGFTYMPCSDNKSVILKGVRKRSVAAKAGLTEGMRLISVNGQHVGNMKSDVVRQILKDTTSEKLVLKFQLPVPPSEPPGIYHLKQSSVIIAAGIVGHIESFLGYTHQYEDPKMAESNVVLAALLKCNTNVQPVGSLSSAMSVLQYLSGYLSKNPVELCNFIACIIAARRRSKRYESTADDAGTESRNAKFLAQKVTYPLVVSLPYKCVCLYRMCPGVSACALVVQGCVRLFPSVPGFN